MEKYCLLILIIFCLSSCKKDEETGPENYLKYMDETYDISKAYLENYGEIGGGLYNFDLTLASSGITITEDGGSGSGNFAYFEIVSSSSSDLAAGKYNYSTSFTTANTFDEGLVGLNIDLAKQLGTYYDLVGGTVDVSREGSIYDVTFNGLLENGNSVTGHYRGTLTMLDYSDEQDYRK